MYNKVEKTVLLIRSRTKFNPKIAIILGSGLGDLVDMIEEKEFIYYKDIPNFPVSTVIGHEGRLVFGLLNGI